LNYGWAPNVSAPYVSFRLEQGNTPAGAAVEVVSGRQRRRDDVCFKISEGP